MEQRGSRQVPERPDETKGGWGHEQVAGMTGGSVRGGPGRARRRSEPSGAAHPVPATQVRSLTRGLGTPCLSTRRQGRASRVPSGLAPALFTKLALLMATNPDLGVAKREPGSFHNVPPQSRGHRFLYVNKCQFRGQEEFREGQGGGAGPHP